MIGIRNSFVILLSILLFCTPVWGECDWTQIKKNSDNTYTYSEPLHLCVGQLVQDNKIKIQQLSDLTQAISLKDLAIKDADQKAALWMNTSAQLEDRVQKLDSMEKHNEWLYFGLGVATTFLAGYMAAKILK